ncbi:uncharacterized protein N7496_010675 [Penicillium cataractarum]|uniref:Uncharacterized protein n=1 Tax=Penicillium cataractarum TaxID=2100454 RepID=A0A9W9V138_9EURO|nr:uncharacterized protein N7496_010675 [Penicillium cataractarum]KAJ5364962.1 hypothetical protein N7496_010675 [Penicillium cataractarum]
MSSYQPWGRFILNEIGIEEARICCGTTKTGVPCKNSIKIQDIKAGQQQLANLATRSLDFSTLRPILCDIAKNFLCARWHRQRQANHVGQKWYEAVARNAEQAGHISEDASVAFDTDASQSQRPTLTTPSESEIPRRVTRQNEERQMPPGRDPVPLEPLERTVRYVTASMLRTDSVPWCISSAEPATLSGFNIGAGMQHLELHSLTRSDEVSLIHCPFCLGDGEDQADESVILRCKACRGLAHLGCVEEWLEKREVVSNVSCCTCRRDDALDALLRLPRTITTNPDIDVENARVHASPVAEETNTIENPRRAGSARLPAQSGSSRRRSTVSDARRSVRRSARLANTTPLRRSSRLNRS